MTEIVTLYESNFRDPAATLRNIADEIEAGTYGDVQTVAIVTMGDTLEVFGVGPESDGVSVATMLQAGALRIIKALESMGK